MFGKDKKEEYHEKILYEAQPNIFVYSKGILISMFVLGFLFFLYSAGIRYIGNMNVYLIETTKVPLTTYFALAIFIFIMIVIAYIIIKLLIWTSIKYTITESRVIVEKGILLQKKNYMPFNTIQDVSRSQSLLGKMFSVGTITLYSAYDGKELELKDVSSPKKIEDLIFENIRGTHLRYRNIYDDNDFNPIRPNSDESTHYRRMEDLDDLELVDAKQRKKELRDIRRKARNSRNNRSNSYDAGYANQNDYGRYEDSYYDDAVYREDRDYYRNRPRDDRMDSRNNSYNRGGYLDSHHHQYSGAIKQSYERNPDKYFANNYEEFHQNNLDAQRDYNQERSAPRDDYYQEPYEDKDHKSKGLSRFNPFSSNKNEDSYRDNISDEEFDSTINQAMHDMDSNIRFEPSNNRDYNREYHNRNRDYDQSINHTRAYRPNQNMERSRAARDDYNQSYSRDNYENQRYDSRQDYYPPEGHNNHYDDYSDRYSSSYRGDDRYNSRNVAYEDNAYNSRNHSNQSNYNQSRNRSRQSNYNQSRYYSGQSNYNQSNYNQSNYNQSNYNQSNYNQSRNNSRDYNQSRRNNDRHTQNNHYENADYNNEYNSGNGKDNKEKTPDDLFAKHSRKFRR